jgi:DNA-binding MarR family transcriptional regulator
MKRAYYSQELVGIPIIGTQMNLEHKQALEIRILCGIIAKSSREAVEKRMAEKGVALSMLQFGILHMVSHHAFTSAELSRKMSLDPSTLFSSIEALVKRGYIRKERDTNDRRRYLLYLTDEAHKFMQELHAVHDDDPLLYALHEIGSEETELLCTRLRKVVETLPEGQSILHEIQARLNPSTLDESKLD